MKIQFLGTGTPRNELRKSYDDRDDRRCSSIMIDDLMIVDPGPDIYKFEKEFGYSGLYDEVETVLCTNKSKSNYSKKAMLKLSAKELKVRNFKTAESRFFTVTAYPANYTGAKNSKCYVIKSKTDGRKIFYSGEGAWLLGPVAEELQKDRYDLMIFEATVGEGSGDGRIFEHNNLAMVKELAKVFAQRTDRFMITHMDCDSHADHETLCKEMAPFGIDVAFDNLTITI